MIKTQISLIILLIFIAIEAGGNCFENSNYDCVPCNQGELGSCRQPKDLTLEKIQAAVNDSADGDGTNYEDGVYLIAGNSPLWSTALNIAKSGLVIKGAGSDSTIINLPYSSSLNIQTARKIRITGVYFKPAYTAISGAGQDIRIDHNRFTSGTYPIFLSSGYLTTGVVDSNLFDGTGVNTYILIRGPDDGAAQAWLEPIDFGSDKWLYVEDNIFNVSSNNVEAIENNWGGKLVVRHNIFNEIYGYNMTTIFEMHNVSCPAPIVGESGNGRAYVAHDNRLNFTTPTSDFRRILYWRSGTGLFYNNIVDYSRRGTDSGIIYFQLHSYRASSSCDDGSTNTSNCYASSLGTKMLARCCSTSYNIGEFQGEGYPCLDAPGSGIWGGTREPLYFWNNKKTADGTTMVDISNGGVHIDPTVQWAVALNRDYCIFSGTTQPSSCGGVALNYTQYPYPHPLKYT